MIKPLGDRVLVKMVKQVEEGTPEEIFDNPKSDRLQHFLAKVL